MNWFKLENEKDLQEAINSSENSPVLLFKHSTRCSISSMALSRLERSWDGKEMNQVKPYYLDLIAHRNISNQIAEHFGVEHQSPQVLLIKKGKCVYDNSHMGISYNDLKKEAASLI
ncbi:bacillithiol system redox-active protein YtxJ [Cytophagales bacterium RKSG123]|nr:bacillithiol system redox-active protein YtxJ [Xanthovirga aplysinae]MTI33067.1 bacillithiol system redox-active protein YtxJ [Xanthovirga aplysinae]